MNTKICAKCGAEKPISEFHKNSRSKDGLHSYCKECNKENFAQYLKTDKGKAAHSEAIARKTDEGYYRYGKGAIPILRQGAEKRGVSFNLTADILEEWWHRQPDICYYCGLTIDEYLEIRDFIIAYDGNNFEISKFKRFYRSPKHQSIRWMTIDRVCNDKGYELKNIVKSCWICNSLKNDFFDAEQIKTITPQIIKKLNSEIEKEKV
jgi:ribosomal protein L44E